MLETEIKKNTAAIEALTAAIANMQGATPVVAVDADAPTEPAPVEPDDIPDFPPTMVGDEDEPANNDQLNEARAALITVQKANGKEAAKKVLSDLGLSTLKGITAGAARAVISSAEKLAA